MLKAKVSLWTTVLIILIIASAVINWIKGADFSTIGGIDITADVISENSTDMMNNIADKKMGDYRLSYNSNNPDVIIKDASDETVPGYIKNENAFYSPMVMFVRNEAYDHQNGFVTVSTKGGISALKIDLRKVLDGMLSDKKWSDIGIDEKIAKGTIKLTIPNERSPYWDEVEALFYMTMNDGKTPTAEEKTALKETVEKLLSKCDKIYDIEEVLTSEVDKPSDNYKVFIGPEFLFTAMNYEEMSYSNNNAYMPAYFYKTVSIYMDVFEKEATNNEIQIQFVESLKATRKLYEYAGFRVTGTTEYYSNTKSGTIDFVP